MSAYVSDCALITASSWHARNTKAGLHNYTSFVRLGVPKKVILHK